VLTFLFLPQPVALVRLCRAVLVSSLAPGKGSLAEAGENQSQVHTGISGMDTCHGRGMLPWSQYPSVLVRTLSQRGTEQFFHFVLGMAKGRLLDSTVKASALSKICPQNTETPQPGMEDGE